MLWIIPHEAISTSGEAAFSSGPLEFIGVLNGHSLVRYKTQHRPFSQISQQTISFFDRNRLLSE